jgi:diguanylate cyclase (GGDEF)-like protein
VTSEAGERWLILVQEPSLASGGPARRLEVDRLTALHEVDRALATLDLDDCLQILVARTQLLFGGVNSALLLRLGDELEVAAAAGYGGTITGVRVHLDQGVCGWVVRQGKPALVPDVDRDPRYLSIDVRARSEMAAPLLLRGECLGAINVESPQVEAFSGDDLEILEMLAGRAAAAIHNARLHRAEREQRQLADTLRDVGLALSTELNPEAILDALLDHVARVVPYDSASVMLLEDGNRVRVRRLRGYEPFGTAGVMASFDIAVDEFSNIATMVRTRRPNLVSDVRADPTWKPTRTSSHIGSWAGAPVLARGRVLGFLSLDKREPGFYRPAQAERLAVFAAQAGLALENAWLYAEQQRLAVTDALTGLANRRQLDVALAHELARATRYGHATALVLFDVDDFKQYNDRFGHPAGDALLRAVAGVLGASLREADLAARYGGDEFGIVLPETDCAEACRAANRVRGLLAELPRPADGRPGLTISLGVAAAPEHGHTPQELVHAADRGLYLAKARGKNQVAAAPAASG